jgi:hypothetical protein
MELASLQIEFLNSEHEIAQQEGRDSTFHLINNHSTSVVSLTDWMEWAGVSGRFQWNTHLSLPAL